MSFVSFNGSNNGSTANTTNTLTFSSSSGVVNALPAGAAIVSSSASINSSTSTPTFQTTTISDTTILTNAYGLPFARSQPILVQASGLKPFASLYAFVNGQSTTSTVIPCARITITGESKTPFVDAKTTTQSTATNALRGVLKEYNTLFSSSYLATLYPQDGVHLGNFQINVGETVRYYISSTQFICGVIISREVEINPTTNLYNTVLHVALLKEFNSTLAYSDNISSSVILSQSAFQTALLGKVIKGDISGATGTVSAVSFPATGSLTTNSQGNFYGIYVIGCGVVPVGQATFKLTDDPTGGLFGTTAAQTTYTSVGILDTFTRSIVQQVNSFTTTTLTGTQTIVYTDPIAETFIIPTSLVNGAMITSVDLFFSSMIPGETQPVIVQITDTSNGYPGQNIIYNATSIVQPNNIKVSANGLTATRFYFQGPVYLQPSVEYALKVLSNSVHYSVYVATMGQPDINKATNIVSTQPYLGSFFQSQNNSTWSANQLVDLKFNINRALFSTSGSVVLNNQSSAGQLSLVPVNPFVTNTSTNIVEVNYPNHGLFAGAWITLSGFDVNSTAALNLGAATTLTTTVTSVININRFTITLAANASLSGTFGGNGIQSTSSIRYDSLAVTTGMYYLPPGTTASSSIQPATATAIASSFTSLPTGIYNQQTSYVHSALNESNLFNNQRSLGIQVNMSSKSSDLSPIFALSSASVGLTSNRINTSTTADNTVVDNITLCSAQASVVFNVTTNIINIPTSIDINQFKIGAMITITGTTSNNQTTEIINIDKTTSPYNVYVAATLIAESPASTTIVQANGYIDDIAPSGSTTLAKYQTIPLTLSNVSSGLQIGFDALIPTAASVELWYRTSLASGSNITNNVWVPITMNYTRSNTNFISQQYSLSALPGFNVVQFKIVMNTTDTSQIPLIQNFSAICLA